MSLNKFTNSVDYLNKQYLNIGCNDIKCTTLEINNEPVGVSFEYNPAVVAVIPLDADFQTITALYNTIGDHMNIDCLFFSVNLPSNTNNLTFKISMPNGYLGFGTGSGFVSLVANCVDANGNEFHPHISQFDVDNRSIVVHMLSTNQLQGLFAISIHITCKVVKE